MSSTNDLSRVRADLDGLGLYQPLPPECVPLVETLLHEIRKRDGQIAGSNRQRYSASKKEDMKRKMHVAERKVLDLQLLNDQAVAIIRRLQKESTDKSELLVRLERGNQRARVITKSADLLKPKIEATSMVKPAPRYPAAASSSSAVPPSSSALDLIAMYERKNAQLKSEAEGLRERLQKERKKASQEAESKCRPQAEEGSGMKGEERSAYVLNLIRENDQLRRRLEEYSAGGGGGGHFQSSHGSHSRAHMKGQRHVSWSCEDIRAAVEESHHVMMHNQCLRNQVAHLQLHAQGAQAAPRPPPPPHSFPKKTLASRGNAHLRAQQEQIAEMQSRLSGLSGENRELRRRIEELGRSRRQLREQLEEARDRQRALLEDRMGPGEGPQVQELIDYIEKQRNMYRNNVERLMVRLDPGKARDFAMDDVDAGDEPDPPPIARSRSEAAAAARPATTSTRKENTAQQSDRRRTQEDESLKALRNIQEGSRRILRERQELSRRPTTTAQVHDTTDGERSYHPSPYRQPQQQTPPPPPPHRGEAEDDAQLRSRLEEMSREISRLRRAKEEAEATSRQDVAERTRLRSLEEENERLSAELASIRRRVGETDTQVHQARQEADASTQAMGDQVKRQQEIIQDLQSKVEIRTRQLNSLTEGRDSLRTQLDQTSIQLAEARKQMEEAQSNLAKGEADARIAESRLHQSLSESERLRSRLAESEAEARNLRERQSADRDVGADARRESAALREELREREAEAEGLRGQAADLRAHVQRYVGEVKRVEEVLATREKEREELIGQYRRLSEEADSAEAFGRRMEAQVESLRMQLSERASELDSAQRRLSQLEKDLVETSLSNENYRSEVARLTAQADVTQSQLREARSQANWVDADLSNVHQMAAQLSSQKVDLQNQISEQAGEIESLNTEINQLKKEVTVLSDQVAQEREKSHELEERLRRERSSFDSGDRR